MKKIFYPIALILLINFRLGAQETISTSGDNYSSEDGYVSITIGQFVNEFYSSGNGSLSQGVQQAYTITTIDGIKEFEDFLCTAHPNPTRDFIKLTTGNSELKNLSYILYGSKGDFIESRRILNTECIINMSYYTPGLYYLLIINNRTEVKSFKIIKN